MWTSPSGKNYVGQAVDLENRKSQFKRLKNKYGGVAIDNARRKYSDFTKWKYQVLEECEIEKLDDREEYWIEYYDSHNPQKGYNLTLGGGGSRGYIASEEARKKISNALKGKYTGESNPNYGRHLTPEEKECRSYNAKFGAGAWQNLMEEEKAARLYREKRLRQKAEQLRRRRIMSIDIESGEEERFDSLSQALKKYKYHKQAIQRILKGQAKTAYGKYWTYQDEDLQEELKALREEYLSKCQRKAKDYWTNERIIDLAKTCSSKKEFSQQHSTAYKEALKNGWLDELFPKAA